ncbi:hypothetical protein M422DRAFT_259227, partial [Sphaerobolus stellatus SS14]
MPICYCHTRRCAEDGGRELDFRVYRQHQRDDVAASYSQQLISQNPRNEAEVLSTIESEILRATLLEPPFQTDMMQEPDILSGNHSGSPSVNSNTLPLPRSSNEEIQLKLTLENLQKIQSAVRDFLSTTLRTLSDSALGLGLDRIPTNYPLNAHVEWFLKQRNTVKTFQGQLSSPLLDVLIGLVLTNINDTLCHIREHYNQWVFPVLHHFDTEKYFSHPLRRANPLVIQAMTSALLLNLLGGISRDHSNFILQSQASLVESAFRLALGAEFDPKLRDLLKEFPKDIRTARKRFDLEGDI